MIEHAYIHIPFCLRKCNYCSFISGENIKNKTEYIKTLIFEIKNRYKKEPLKTLYIGGGTPSLLDTEDINRIINCFKFCPNPEITLEANPETVEKDKFNNFKQIGINRISLGIQTFNDEILKLIGRNHTSETIFNSLEIIKNSGLKNISVDLIYGLPNQTKEIFIQDLEKAIKLDIQHISTYGLKIEDGSYYYKHYPKNLPDDEMQADMFLYLCDFLEKNGFEHYEISNFAIKGFESKHNLCYWHNKNYYGFGLNASGYEGKKRYKNKSILNDYLNNPLQFEEQTVLTDNQKKEEEIFLALRLKEGISTDKIAPKYSIIIEKYTRLNLVEIKNNHLKLTKQGILLSNEIMSEFIEE